MKMTCQVQSAVLIDTSFDITYIITSTTISGALGSLMSEHPCKVDLVRFVFIVHKKVRVIPSRNVLD